MNEWEKSEFPPERYLNGYLLPFLKNEVAHWKSPNLLPRHKIKFNYRIVMRWSILIPSSECCPWALMYIFFELFLRNLYMNCEEPFFSFLLWMTMGLLNHAVPWGSSSCKECEKTFNWMMNFNLICDMRSSKRLDCGLAPAPTPRAILCLPTAWWHV